MSRIAKQPVPLPKGVTATITPQSVTLKGAKGTLSVPLTAGVAVVQENDQLAMQYDDTNRMQAGATRAHLANIAKGVSTGYEIKLELVGVGYRAAVQGKTLNLTLGFSHPINFPVPDGITIEAPSQTEVLIKGIDKQQVGNLAADIRAIRKPEPYLGKGIKYTGEHIRRKQGKTGKK